jgi:2-desacetyl-2-hydroxyethyl bacteriochlorophyllide A dehydrogenase
MKAVVFREKTGLVLEEVPIPEIDTDQVLVKVANTGFCGSDHSLVETEGTPDGVVLGHEVSGRVVETGKAVTGVKEGMKVIIRPTFCGNCVGCRAGKPQLCSNNRRSIGIGDLSGGFAEYIKAFPQMLIPVPETVSSQNAALAELYSVALHAINLSEKNGGSVLVIGAGAVGLALVKLLKVSGFSPIIVSEPSVAKRDLALKFGADQVIDPLQNDLVASSFGITNGEGFSTVFECAGLPDLISVGMNVVGPGGTVCQISVVYKDIMINPAILLFKEIRLTGSYGNTHEENIQCLKWMADKKLDAVPLISDYTTLDELPGLYKDKISTGNTIKVMINIGEEF